MKNNSKVRLGLKIILRAVVQDVLVPDYYPALVSRILPMKILPTPILQADNRQCPGSTTPLCTSDIFGSDFPKNCVLPLVFQV